jgi:hypothetical protein
VFVTVLINDHVTEPSDVIDEEIEPVCRAQFFTSHYYGPKYVCTFFFAKLYLEYHI